MTRAHTDAHRFWRDPALPFLEARAVEDGRRVCYGLHSHRAFSIGIVAGGRSDYRIGGDRHVVQAGTVVLMNPDEAHACNPLDGLPWSYRMLYADVEWLTGVQGGPAFVPYSPPLSTDPVLYRRLGALFETLFGQGTGAAGKEAAARAFFADLHRRLERGTATGERHAALERAAAFITANCTRPLRLAEVCGASGLSPSYLVRAFKARYGLTPHAYQLNRRIQFGQRELRRGRTIVEVALDAGFADQAHFQRAFKRHTAATPRQYAIPA